MRERPAATVKTGGDSLDGDSVDISRKRGTNTPPGSFPYKDSCDTLRRFIMGPPWLLQPTLFRTLTNIHGWQAPLPDGAQKPLPAEMRSLKECASLFLQMIAWVEGATPLARTPPSYSDQDYGRRRCGH